VTKDRTGLPPWAPKTEEEERWLIDWTIARLDEIDWDRSLEAFETAQKYLNGALDRGLAIEMAWNGRPEALRRFHPDIAGLINPPPRKRGQRRPQAASPAQKAVADAVADVKRIRKIWKEKLGSKNRGEDNKVTAARVAAQRLINEYGDGEPWTVEAFRDLVDLIADREKKGTK
jgi:hypothetical protein